MAVLIEAISVAIRAEVLHQSYPGGSIAPTALPVRVRSARPGAGSPRFPRVRPERRQYRFPNRGRYRFLHGRDGARPQAYGPRSTVGCLSAAWRLTPASVCRKMARHLSIMIVDS